jgi:putative DNA primase/helicase
MTSNIPDVIKKINQWVYWIPGLRSNGKTSKPPRGRKGPNEWQFPKNQYSFHEAFRLFTEKKPSNIGGIGIAFNGSEPFTAFDLDNCLKDGKLEPWARSIVDSCDSYTEISPSGNGLRIFVSGKIPGIEPKRKFGDLEIFSAKGYVTVTGNVFEKRKELRENIPAMTSIYKKYSEKTISTGEDFIRQPVALPSPVEITDDLILTASKNDRTFQELWSKQNSEDHSKDDLSLCLKLAFYSNNNAAQIDSLFRRSSLMRDKWNEKHGTKTYGQMTIEKAIGKSDKTFDWSNWNKPKTEKKTEKIEMNNDADFDEKLSAMRGNNKIRDRILIPARDTDSGNAERFEDAMTGKVIHTPEMGWLIWSLNKWEANERRVREAFKEAISEDIHKEIDELNQKRDKESIDLMGKLSKWLKQSRGAKLITSGLQWAYSDSWCRGEIGDFDKDLYLLNVLNGVIDLRTGNLRKHNPQDKITKIVEINYDSSADCPLWKDCLNTWFEGKKDLIDYVQKYIGYTLTGETIDQSWIFLHGHGKNGKSKFIEILAKLAGTYGKKTDINVFAENPNSKESATPELAEFPGKRFVFATETQQGKAFDCGKIKDWTGGEVISARQLYKIPFNFKPQFKLWISGNHKPIIKDSTFATWRRIRFIPFNVTIPDSQQDERLSEKLESELPGILKWAVEGCSLWQREGLKAPNEVVAATTEYQESQDRLSPFIKEACIVGKKYYSIPFKLLHEAYLNYCQGNNDNAMSKPAFREGIQERGYKIDRGTGHAVFIYGIMLKPENQHESAVENDYSDGRVTPVTAVTDFTRNGYRDTLKTTSQKIGNSSNSSNSNSIDNQTANQKDTDFTNESDSGIDDDDGIRV